MAGKTVYKTRFDGVDASPRIARIEKALSRERAKRRGDEDGWILSEGSDIVAQDDNPRDVYQDRRNGLSIEERRVLEEDFRIRSW